MGARVDEGYPRQPEQHQLEGSAVPAGEPLVAVSSTSGSSTARRGDVAETAAAGGEGASDLRAVMKQVLCRACVRISVAKESVAASHGCQIINRLCVTCGRPPFLLTLGSLWRQLTSGARGKAGSL